MTAEPYELFSDPARLIDDGLIAKRLGRERLNRLFAVPPEREPSPGEAELDALADVIADRVVRRLDSTR